MAHDESRCTFWTSQRNSGKFQLADHKLAKRIITAVILIPIVVVVVYVGPSWLVAIIAAAVALLERMEYCPRAARIGLRQDQRCRRHDTAALNAVDSRVGCTVRARLR